MRYINETIAYSRYSESIKKLELIAGGYLTLNSSTFTPTFTFGANNSPYLYSYEGRALYADINRDMKLSGIFDYARNIYYADKLVVMLDEYLAVSSDNINWNKFKLPSNKSIVLTYSNFYNSYVFFNGSVCVSINSPVLRSNSSYPNFKLPEDFLSLPTAIDSGTNISDIGYICNQTGYWSPKPVYHLCSTSYIASSYSAFKVANSNIIDISIFSGLGKHWVDGIWSWEWYDYVGAFVDDYEKVQFFSCSNGEISFRLLSSSSLLLNNTVQASSIAVPSDTVYNVIQYKFIYDKDSINQATSTLQVFEKYYAVASNGLYELTWNGISFDYLFVLADTFDTVLYYTTEYVTKWNYYGSAIVGIEVHRLHIYCKNGKHIVVDSSDKSISTIYGSFSMGVEFKSFTFYATEDHLFTSIDNKLYKLANYNSLELKASIDFDTIIMRNRWILTDYKLYYLDNTLGISNAIDPYYTRLGVYYNSSNQPVYFSTRYHRRISIYYNSYDNSYVLFDYDTKYEYITTDFLVFNEHKYTEVPYTSTATLLPQITSIIEINSVKYFINAYSDYPIFRKEVNEYVAGFQNEQVISSAKYAIPYNGSILSEVTNSVAQYDTTYLRALISSYSEQLVGILKSNEIITSISYEQPEYLLASLSIRTNLYRSSHTIYTASQAIIISGTAHHVDAKLAIRQLDDTIVYEQVVSGLNFNSDIKVLFINIPDNYVDHYLDIKFYAKKSYNDSSANMHFSINVHKIINVSFKVRDDLGLIKLQSNEHIINDFNDINYILSGNWQMVTNSHIQYYISLEDLLGLNTEAGTDYSLFYDGGLLYLIKRVLTARISIYEYNFIGSVSLTSFNNGVESEVFDQKVLDWFDTIKPNLLNMYTSYMGVLTIKLVYSFLTNGLAVNTGTGTIDFKYPASTSFTELIAKDSNRIAINSDGYFSLETRSSSAIGTQSQYGWHHYILMQKISSYSLLDILYFTVGSKTRIVACNVNGDILYTDSIYHNWVTSNLSQYKLNKLIYFDKNGYKLAVCGSNGELYISLDYAISFNKITIPTSINITCMSYFGTRLFLFGDNTICFSDDLTNWTLLGHNLEFLPLTAYISQSVLYVGCKDGVIIKTNDGTYWSYMSSNTKADINKFVYAIGNVNFYYPNPIFYSLIANFIDKIDYSKIHSGDLVYFNNVETVVHEVTNVAIDGFNVTPSYTGVSVVPMTKMHVWTDVLINPKFKIYTDSSCTNELQQQLYVSATNSLIDTGTDYRLEITFESNDILMNISYVCGYLWLDSTSSYSNIVFEFSSKIELTNYKTAVFNIAYTDIPIGYDVRMENMKFVGIPSNSLWLDYFASTDETIISYLYIKLIDDTLYDNLTITSRSQYSNTRFLFNSLIWNAQQYDSSKLHGFNRTRAIAPKENNEYWPLSSPYSSQSFYNGIELELSDSLLRYISIGSYCISHGVLGIVSSIAKQSNNKYIINTTYPSGITPYSNSGFLSETYAKHNIVLINGSASLSLGDRSGNYYIIKSIDCSFRELKNVTNGVIIFNNRCYTKSQQLTSSGYPGAGWYYISDTSIAIHEFYYFDSYRLIYSVPISAYTGQVSYIKLEDNFGYTTDSLQPLYDFEPGNLEFSLDSEPNSWERILDLPQMTKNTTIKVNVKQTRVNFKPGLLANIVTIHGVEYLV